MCISQSSNIPIMIWCDFTYLTTIYIFSNSQNFCNYKDAHYLLFSSTNVEPVFHLFRVYNQFSTQSCIRWQSNEDEFPFESGFSKGFFLMTSQCRRWFLIRDLHLQMDFCKSGLWQALLLKVLYKCNWINWIDLINQD